MYLVNATSMVINDALTLKVKTFRTGMRNVIHANLSIRYI